MINTKVSLLITFAISLIATIGHSQAVVNQQGNTFVYSAEMSINAGSGEFAPYYIASNQHGTTTQSKGAQLRLQAHSELDTTKRFAWSGGIDIITNATNATNYIRYDRHTATWAANPQRPAAFWLQQLYVKAKWRSLFLTVGLKQHQSKLLNNRLASGDLTESGNARPMPEIRAGMIDFRNIPYTNEWLQIQGELAYGKPTDSNWLRNHFNYYNYFITTGWIYNYKRIYFRTKPEQPLSVTFGMQAAGQFNGTQYYYSKGALAWEKREPFKISNLLSMLIPRTDDSYYEGNHLGSWDLKARYQLPKGDKIYVYFQWPWEDGSGIGKLNGFDGTWGVEWKKSTTGPISGIVAELLYFMNQSGPIHFDPEDLTGTTIPAHTDGSDDYYNNYFYNGYAYYGMGLGSPIFPSPIYNTDGYMRYSDTRLRGFHVGISGELYLPGHSLSYRILGGYREVFGSGYVPRQAPAHDSSLLVEANWQMKRLPTLCINAQLGIDRGTIYGNQTGFKLGVLYTGALTFRK